VVRNTNDPTLRYTHVDGTPGRVITIQPHVDWGMRTELDGRAAISADVHNINCANNRGAGLHVGLDFRALGGGHVHLGFTDGAPTHGVGAHLGRLYLDTAVGTEPMTASVGAHPSI
jgi:hypothetical protein